MAELQKKLITLDNLKSFKGKLEDLVAAGYAGKGYEAKVDTLIGDDADSSVRSIAAAEVAKVVADAPEAFDTLKEIADWIGTGDVQNTTAASLLSDVEALQGLVGNHASGEGEDAVAASGLCKDIADNAADIAANATDIAALQKLVGNHASGDGDDAVEASGLCASVAANAAAIAALQEAIGDGDSENSISARISTLEDNTANTAEATESSDADYISVSVTTENGGVTAVSAEATVATEDDIFALFEVESAE